MAGSGDGMKKFADRAAGGRALAAEFDRRGLIPERWADPVVVLALPRGGLPVAVPVAERLGARLSVVLVRKIGAPDNPELAIGAVAAVGDEVVTIRNESVLADWPAAEQSFAAAEHRERAELEGRRARYASLTPALPSHASIVLVDDGLATGSTMLAAVAAVRTLDPASVTVAVPVGSRFAVQVIGAVADRVLCPLQPEPFLAVGYAYSDFRQVSDEEVTELLAAHRR